jgi:hypothetical protein
MACLIYHQSIKRVICASFCTLALTATTACTGTSTKLSGGVSQAYNSTGVIDVPSYNRSIFSSTNF